MVGAGALNYLPMINEWKLDIIPVDISANQTIAATAFKGYQYMLDKVAV